MRCRRVRALLLFLTLVTLAGAFGCRSKTTDGDAAGSQRGGKSAAPAEGALCKEHGVLEALCTKHNPALIPVFQAKGDWCAEHGFPESICPICHPERGGRPPGDVAADGAPADGTKVRFKKKDTADLTGIATAKAIVRDNAGGVVATARLVYDATKLAHVNARSPGVVRALKVDVGASVKEGDALAIIDSAEVGAIGRGSRPRARA